VALLNVKTLPYWNEIQKELDSFEEDKLLSYKNGYIKVEELGKGFTRNMAMTFDFYLRDQQSLRMFSQTI